MRLAFRKNMTSTIFGDVFENKRNEYTYNSGKWQLQTEYKVQLFSEKPGDGIGTLSARKRLAANTENESPHVHNPDESKKAT